MRTRDLSSPQVREMSVGLGHSPQVAGVRLQTGSEATVCEVSTTSAA